METPTFEDWLALMPLVADRGWRIDRQGFIRDREGRCPVCALAYELSRGEADWDLAACDAALEIGVEIDATVSVVDAADLLSAHGRPALMQALGMAA